MSQQIKIKTETEKILFDYYNASKKDNLALQDQVERLQAQVVELQQKLQEYVARDQTQAEIEKTNKGSSSHNVEYSTDEEELAKETEWVRAKSRKKRKMNTSRTSTHSQQEYIRDDPIPKPKRIPPPPPIVVEGIKDYQQFFDFLVEKVKEESFKIKMMSSGSAKINANEEDSYRNITMLLSQSNILWHSYENKQTRPFRVMAKNLHCTYKVERIVEDLKKRGLKIESAVNKLKWKNKEPLNMFMLTFNKEEDVKKIYAIDTILGCKVEIHPLKTPKLIPQCKRCQGYGHTQRYCSKEPRCVKCTGKHLTKDCVKPAEHKPKCVHCGQSHPANYRGCLVAKEMQEMKNKAAKRNQTIGKLQNKTTNSAHVTPVQSKTRPGVSFAQAVTKATVKSNTEQNKTLEDKLNQILNYISSFDERLKNLEKSNRVAALSRT